MTMMCLRRFTAPLCRHAALRVLSARPAAVSGLEPASWQRGHTPVAGCAWLHGTGWTGVRWSVCRGGRRASADSLRVLLGPKVRGFCDGKSRDAPDPPEDGTVPEQGLFNFKELVSDSETANQNEPVPAENRSSVTWVDSRPCSSCP